MRFYYKFWLILLPVILVNDLNAACDFEVRQDRAALVIGNSRYTDINPLENPGNDAKAIGVVLRSYGFSVIERLDQDYNQMLDTISCFENTLKPGGVGLLYYAGHGVQLGQYNYLLPTDLKIDENDPDKENQIRTKAIDLNDILWMIKQAELETNIIILDACRDNPFQSKTRGLFIGKVQRNLAEIAKQGFAEISEMSAPAKSYIAFATSPGQLSSDGEDGNGLFTANLLKYLKNPNLDISMVFAKTAADVYKASYKKQIPWRKTSLFDAFYFSPSQQRKVAALIHSDASGFNKYYLRGLELLQERGRPRKAITLFKKSLKYSPNNVDALYHMALANVKLFNEAEAIFLLKKVLNLNPEYKSAYSLLAQSYAKLGDSVNAEFYQAKAK